MIPQAHITAWRQVVPWADDAQVEQDLVQTEAAPVGTILDALRARLDRGPSNVALAYRFESEISPVRPLRLKIEMNTREHFALLGHERRSFAVQYPWFSGQCEVVTFTTNELMATKLRALYQRRKGRDLFDLWLCLDRGKIDPAAVAACFLEYMQREGHAVSRAEFEQNLHEKEQDPAFMTDIGPLLRPQFAYDAAAAMAAVRKSLIALLPGDAWQGSSSGEPKKKKRGRKRE